MPWHIWGSLRLKSAIPVFRYCPSRLPRKCIENSRKFRQLYEKIYKRVNLIYEAYSYMKFVLIYFFCTRNLRILHQVLIFQPHNKFQICNLLKFLLFHTKKIYMGKLHVWNIYEAYMSHIWNLSTCILFSYDIVTKVTKKKKEWQVVVLKS